MVTVKQELIGIFLLNFILSDVLGEECSCVYLKLDEIKTCKDWDTAPVKVDVKIDMDDEYGSLNGKILAGAAITQGIEISMFIMLRTHNGEELVYSAAADLCHSLSNKDAMWYPIVEVFNTSSCPVAKGQFAVNDVKISLGSLKDIIFNKDFIGDYSIIISMEMPLSKLMCFVLGAEILEEKRPCDECPFS